MDSLFRALCLRDGWDEESIEWFMQGGEDEITQEYRCVFNDEEVSE